MVVVGSNTSEIHTTINTLANLNKQNLNDNEGTDFLPTQLAHSIDCNRSNAIYIFCLFLTEKQHNFGVCLYKRRLWNVSLFA
ncbi:hypothetical protein KSF78_0007742 [Schistosoma japonicum]|nr:hypothetical protein KSF78_0007742 [Schistosoma japonicum]